MIKKGSHEMEEIDQCKIKSISPEPFLNRSSVEIQLKLVRGVQETQRSIKRVTLTLSGMEEAWHIFEDLTNLAWKKAIQKQV